MNKGLCLYEIGEYSETGEPSGKLISEFRDFLNDLYRFFKRYDSFFVVFFDSGRCAQNKSILTKTASYQLPLESLMSYDISNLFAIGMLVGAEFKAHSALRVQKSCMSMGEGVAKYLAKNL